MEPSQIQIQWCNPLFDFSGYAYACRETILALDRQGVSQSLIPLNKDPQFIDQLRYAPEILRTWRRLLTNRLHHGIAIQFSVPMDSEKRNVFKLYRHVNPGFAAYVGITMFETDRLPQGWAGACNSMDEIWVPSTFNQETFVRHGVNPEIMQVIPLGINTQLYNPDHVEPMPIPNRRSFTFLSVFQWNKRKGWDVLLRAYLQAFTKDDDVCLVLRTYRDYFRVPSIKTRIDNFVKELGYHPNQIPPIIMLDDFIPERGMPSLYAAADVFVLPTRGEGWGIPFMESMAMGKPVIATRWSGHLDFMNDSSSYLIDIDGLTPVDPSHTKENRNYDQDHLWAEPSLKHTASLMRQAYDNRNELRAKGKRARQTIHESWHLDRTAQWVIRRTEHLLALKPAQGNNNLIASPGSTSPNGLAPGNDVAVAISKDFRKLAINTDELTIGIDARTLTYSASLERGIGHYTIGLVTALIDQTPHWHYVLCLDTIITNSVINSLSSHPHVKLKTFEFIKEDELDLFLIPDPMSIFPDSTSPFLKHFNVPLAVIWHDLIPLVLPGEFLKKWPIFQRLEYLRRIKQVKKSEALLLAVSNYSKQDLLQHLKIPSEQVKVIRAGLNKAQSLEDLEPQEIHRTLNHYAIQPPFFLTIGSLEPHKNFPVTIEAFNKLPSHHNARLVVIGSQIDASNWDFYKNNVKGNTSRTIFTGFISRTELEHLYASATAFILASKYEGFGFPVLEAMAFGCPVIATNATAIPELIGDAAMLVSPNNPDEITKAMIALLEKPELYQHLSKQGIVQAQQFTWDDVANRAIDAIRQHLSGELYHKRYNLGSLSNVILTNFINSGLKLTAFIRLIIRIKTVEKVPLGQLIAFIISSLKLKIDKIKLI